MSVKYGMWDQSKGKDEALGDVEVKFHRDEGTDLQMQEVIGYASSRQVVVRIAHPDLTRLTSLLGSALRACGLPNNTKLYEQHKPPTFIGWFFFKQDVGSFDLVKEATKARDLLESEWRSDAKIPRRYVNGRLARPDVGKSELER